MDEIPGSRAEARSKSRSLATPVSERYITVYWIIVHCKSIDLQSQCNWPQHPQSELNDSRTGMKRLQLVAAMQDLPPLAVTKTQATISSIFPQKVRSCVFGTGKYAGGYGVLCPPFPFGRFQIAPLLKICSLWPRIGAIWWYDFIARTAVVLSRLQNPRPENAFLAGNVVQKLKSQLSILMHRIPQHSRLSQHKRLRNMPLLNTNYVVDFRQ